MKKIALAAVVPFIFISNATFAGTQNCATRISIIQNKIDYARQWGNAYKVAGLERKLANIKAHCGYAGQTGKSVRDVQSREKDVREAQAEVSEASAKLRAAQDWGDPEKIRQAQKKLADKQDKLNRKMDKLYDARADLAAQG